MKTVQKPNDGLKPASRKSLYKWQCHFNRMRPRIRVSVREFQEFLDKPELSFIDATMGEPAVLWIGGRAVAVLVTANCPREAVDAAINATQGIPPFAACPAMGATRPPAARIPSRPCPSCWTTEGAASATPRAAS